MSKKEREKEKKQIIKEADIPANRETKKQISIFTDVETVKHASKQANNQPTKQASKDTSKKRKKQTKKCGINQKN